MREFSLIWLVVFAACTTGGDDDSPILDAALIDAGAGSPGDAGSVVTDRCTDGSRGSTIGRTCGSDAECDDGCFCNGVEACSAETCVAGGEPCADDVECTVNACLEETDRCFTMPNHRLCSDGNECNGAEVCAPDGPSETGCEPAASPECNDESTCTFDTCDAELGCVFTPRDLDMDGVISGACGGEDCDDDPRFGRDIYPGADENCENRRDDNCDGLRDYSDTSCVPTNEDCVSARILPGPGTYSGATRGLVSNYSLTCGGGSGPDAVFRFHLDEMRDVRIDLAGGGFSPAIALREYALCTAGPNDKCASGEAASILRRSLPPGDYAIIVKTSSPEVFDLVLRFMDPTPPPANDVCNGSTQDVSAGGTFTGLFSESEDDYRVSCNEFGTGNRDVALRFTIPAGTTKDVTIDAVTSATFTQTFLALTTDCEDTGATLGCSSPFGGTATVRRRGLTPGTYYILVESGDTTAANWTVTVRIEDAVPRLPGDACGMPINITAAPGSVDLSMMEFDSGNSCLEDEFGVDAVFAFDVPPGGADALVTGMGTSFFYGMSVSTSCGTFGSELRCSTGSSLTQRYRSLPAGRYYVTMSTRDHTGTLGASVAITVPPTPIPRNDRCAGAIPLGSDTVTPGTLDDYGDDTRTCLFGSETPDAFYSVRVTVPSFLTLVVTPRAGFSGSPTLTVKSSCADSSWLNCSTGTPAAFSQEVEPGLYYVIVEASSTFDAGDFTITTLISPL
jgi:hypothetical protein